MALSSEPDDLSFEGGEKVSVVTFGYIKPAPSEISILCLMLGLGNGTVEARTWG